MSRSTTSLASARTDRPESKEKPIELADTPDIEKQALSPTREGHGTGAGCPPGGGPPGFSENDLYKPKTLKFWSVLLSSLLAMFLVALDRTIIATAIPRITDEFESLGDIGWYGSAYMLTTSCSQLIFGRIYKHYNMKYTFLISIVVFEIGSAICGAAPNSKSLIAGRAIAGAASAGIFSGTMMIMIPMIPLHKRPMFQGLFGMVFGLASVLGPLIGGGFTGSVSWRWCFYINLPIGAVTLVVMILLWNPPPQEHESVTPLTHIKRLDPIGMLFFLPGIVCLLLALQWGGSTYSWNDGRIIALFVVFAVLILAYAAVQILKPKTATIPPKIIAQRSVFFGALFTFFIAGAMLVSVSYLPIWFQTVKLVDPLKSGIYTIPIVLSLVAASMVSGFVTTKIGYYVPAMYVSPAIMAIGEGLMSTFNPSTSSSKWIAYQFLTGFGLGFGMQTAGLAMQTVLPREDVSIGLAINFFAQQLGGAVFVSVGQTILSNLLVSRLQGIPGLDPTQIVGSGATDLVKLVPPQYMDLVIQAYNYACTRIFLCGLGLTFAALLSVLGMEWRSIKKGKQGPGGPGGPGGPAAAGPKGPAAVGGGEKKTESQALPDKEAQ
ncbi:MFS general substrate transporter [Coniochaeta ligniaria NRRL 30616]|uniref:MFS general substrate transporter n=1 Tax=Coniochaeta ligniaria NRRL 30616 TaxID=1408157 RepID=A0A1J7IX05_9PEZI|nr:MFS general substrate transporter [Coniochaeta ligniaria NRRL 30616]